MSDKAEDLFTTVRRDGHPLSAYLDRQLRPLQQMLESPDTLNFDLNDEVLVEQLMELFDVTPPTVQHSSKRGPIEINYYGQQGYRFELVVALDGDAGLVDHWPDEAHVDESLARTPVPEYSSSDPIPPHWRRRERELAFRYEYLANPSDAAEELFAQEQERVEMVIAAIGSQVEQFRSQTRARVRSAVERKRRKYEEARATYDAIDLPEYRPPELNIEVRPADEPEDRSAESVITMLPRRTVRDDDWATYVDVLRRWTSVIERNPASFESLDETTLRDLLLATLHTVYPVALGEVMTKGRKSDIYVIPTPEEPALRPIITELKIWDGPARVADDLDQHLDQLTVRDTRGALIYIMRLRSFDGPIERLHRAVGATPGFQDWGVDPGTAEWPVANFVSTRNPYLRTAITIGAVLAATSLDERSAEKLDAESP